MMVSTRAVSASKANLPQGRVRDPEQSPRRDIPCRPRGTCKTPRTCQVFPKGNRRNATMEFGMFHEFQRRPGQTEAEAFTESFEQVDAAERAGLDAMWLPAVATRAA